MMEKPIENYWQLRLQSLQKALGKNNFDVHTVANAGDGYRLAIDTIIPSLNIKSVSWGGSMTFQATGLYPALSAREDLTVIDTYDKSIGARDMLERRRQALLADLFITGTNAVTEKGQLVNLDMIGNRVAALTFGPRFVLLFIGRNKLVEDVPAAMAKIKNYTAPTNVMRLDKQTPCAHTGYCQNCHTPDRICNHWTITEKSFPKGRIKVILINEDLGL